jgi:hypothetical protein
VVSAHEDVRNASLLTLSCTLRTALDAYDDKAARDKLGEMAKKDGPLGLLMGQYKLYISNMDMCIATMRRSAAG